MVARVLTLIARLVFVAVAASGCSLSNVDDLTAGGVPGRRSPRCERLPGCGPENDCCAAYELPDRLFQMGRGAADAWDGAPPDETPEKTRQVSRVSIDAFEVTVARFRPFVDEYERFIGAIAPGAGGHPAAPGSGWDPSWRARLPADRAALETHISECGLSYTWSAQPGNSETRPINCVDWYVAFAFCAWDGGWLPSEAEWELAASGAQDRLFPWGADELTLPSGCAAGRPDRCDVADVPAAGASQEPRARWGHHDLGGGVAEWTLDLYRSAFYAEAPAGCVDCVNLVPGEGLSRVLRGGSWQTVERAGRRAAARFATPPVQVSQAFGLRCARAAR